MAYIQVTRAQLRTMLEERYEAVPYWTTDEANDALNEMLLTWGMLTGRWRSTVTLQTTAGTVDYAIPPGLSYRVRVAFDGLPLSPASRTEMNLGRPNWWNERTTDGGSVPRRPTLWIPISLNLLAIWPADAAGHHSLTVEGVANTPVLTDDAQFVDLAEADFSPLLGFALHVLSLKKGGPWLAKTLPDYRAFLAAAAEENSLIASSQFYRRFMGLDRRDLKLLKGAPAAAPAEPPA